MTFARFDWIAMAACTAVAVSLLATSKGRAAWMNYLRLWRRMFAEWPLRRISGRRRPDYARIAELEREIDRLDHVAQRSIKVSRQWEPVALRTQEQQEPVGYVINGEFVSARG